MAGRAAGGLGAGAGLLPLLQVLLLASPGTAWGRQLLAPGETGVVEGRKPCPSGCGTRGHCNYETGRCECPWGWDGDTCDVDTLAACKQTPDDPGGCGNWFPKNCECYRACFKMYCRYGVDTHRCRVGDVHYYAGGACWLYGNNETGTAGALARPQVSSRYPENPETETIWYDQIPEFFRKDTYDEDMRLKDARRIYLSSMHRPDIPHMQWKHTARALSRCPNGCSNGHGSCFHWEWEKEPRCMCRLGFNGTDCSGVETEKACSFSPTCGGVGTCLSGFCKCPDGRWGWGCHRSNAYLPQQPQPVPDLRSPSLTRFKIYMYDLPWEASFPHEMFEWVHARDSIYQAEEFFIENFLTDTVVRTENPYEAHLFYIPALTMYYSGNVGNSNPQIEYVINYVRQNWPFYNRSGGADHFVWTVGDRGSCFLDRWIQDDVIKVVHFGMQVQDHPWRDVRNRDYGCLQLKRDVVAPPHSDMFLDQAAGIYRDLEANQGRDPARTKLLVFAGGVGDGTEYSGGTRQTLFRLLSNASDLEGVDLISGRVPDYDQRLRASKFCFSPYGYGFGIRLAQAMQTGCIPLVIQDMVYQPFEDTMPYEEFAVRLPLRDVPRLVEILRSYSDDALAGMRMAMAKYYRAFIWQRRHRGLAYEFTLAALQRRAYSLQAAHFRGGSGGGGGGGEGSRR
ncbi:hypothetical protein HYH03_015043 [Edaphochlamys debaryana]|uniref:EGF-like domain-containing protein n=1 Tax=Edaphochlamys debaryana TaxID=47281 RepID=A0A836BSZ9_9CHLO|nr:hypothetical protein HYH03_015043 [Edaphochlamys debaryana]|eukprot:KAG2486339.1 hypothetical protein HYH03_015043 [Edaphochlamys debaryana]